jgi:predicted RNA-binding protein with PUA-like domain
MDRNHWLFKSEPDVFSIDDLRRDAVTAWEGVRNYQARNFLRDTARIGDLVLFYHSNADPTGVAGVAKIVKAGYPDPSALDKQSPYHDPKATRDANPWVMVDLAFVQAFRRVVTLDELRSDPRLDGLLVTKRGQRLSIQPVTPEHFQVIVKLGHAPR